MNALTKYWENLSPTEKTLLAVGGAIAVVATGGAFAYAVAGAESAIIVAGPLLLATGEAAKEVAKRV